MFNKKTKQKNQNTGTEDKITNYVKMHTMQDDISGKTTEDQEGVMTGGNSPFLGGKSTETKNVAEEKMINNSVPKNNNFPKTNKANIAKIKMPSREDIRPDISNKPFIASPVHEPMSIPKKKEPLPLIPTPRVESVPVPTPMPTPIPSPEVVPTPAPSSMSMATEIPIASSMNGVNKNKETINKREELMPKRDKTKEKNEVKIVENKKQHGSRKGLYISFFGVVVLILTVIGAYLFWQPATNNILASIGIYLPTNAEPTKPTEPIVPVIPVELGEPVTEIPKFSDKVNFLTIEGEINNASLMVAINQALFEVGEEGVTNVEFLLVDSDNNEISLKVFADAMGIKIKEALMEYLTGRFSIIMHSQVGIERIDLAIDVNNEEQAKEIILKNENSLVADFTPLFLGNPVSTELATQPFQSSEYGEYIVRYNNVNENKDLSIDYTFINNQWIVATSMISGRATIDKLTKINQEEDNLKEGSVIEMEEEIVK